MDISVIVPIYKGRKYIPSIQKMVSNNVEYAANHQMNLNVELLLINDYPDESINEYVKNTDMYEIRVVNNEINSGIHKTRVNGLSYSSGEFILFLDQDDKITDNCFYSQISAITDYDIVVGNGYRGVKGNYKKIYKSHKKQSLCCNELIYVRAANQIVSPGHCLIRKWAISKAWCENIITDNGGDDLFLWLLMFEEKKRFTVNFECVYKHVDTGINLSSNLDAMYKSSDNIIYISRKCRIISKRTIDIYERRIIFLRKMQTKNLLKKGLACLSNLDICVAKLYAYYI